MSYDMIEAAFEEAQEAVLSDRNETHGHVDDNIEQIAAFWSVYLGVEVKPVDVCMMMILTKVSRQKVGTTAWDHYVDIVGYGGIGAGMKDKNSFGFDIAENE